MAGKRSVNTKQYVRSVTEYLKWVKDIQGDKPPEKIFYRGMADTKWDITPSLFRYNTNKSEKELLQSATNLIWNELKNTTTYLEKLIILQHYGFPTRLLDVTTNPLVALYFACWQEEKKDGSVYVSFADNLTNIDNNDSIEHICKLLFQENYEFINLNFWHSYKITDWTPFKILHLFNFNTTIEDFQKQLKQFVPFNFQLLKRERRIKDLNTLQNIFNTQLGFKIGTEQIYQLILQPIINLLNSELENNKETLQTYSMLFPSDNMKDFYGVDYDCRAISVRQKLGKLFNDIFDELSKSYPKLTSERERLEKELRSYIQNILYDSVKIQKPPLVIKLIMCYMLKTICSENKIDSNRNFLGSFDLTKIENLQQLTQTYFISPPLNNDRIIAQSGAFIMPSLLNIDKGDSSICDKEIDILIYLYINQFAVKCREDIRYKEGIHFESKIEIPLENKADILKELATYGIHEGSLFPDTEHKLKYLADSNSIKK